MANWSNEAEAREQIKALVAEYYHDFKEKKTDFKPGDRVTYASRVFDEKEMCALTDATLDFWLTTGRFADEFEKEFANPRTPCGVRPLAARSTFLTTQFQSTHSLRSATLYSFGIVNVPHSFNPRTPCGVRHDTLQSSTGATQFQSTHSLRSATH